MHHNPCFNLFILHKKLFANQESEINKNIYIYIIRNINTKDLNAIYIPKTKDLNKNFKGLHVSPRLWIVLGGLLF